MKNELKKTALIRNVPDKVYIDAVAILYKIHTIKLYI